MVPVPLLVSVQLTFNPPTEKLLRVADEHTSPEAGVVDVSEGLGAGVCVEVGEEIVGGVLLVVALVVVMVTCVVVGDIKVVSVVVRVGVGEMNPCGVLVGVDDGRIGGRVVVWVSVGDGPGVNVDVAVGEGPGVSETSAVGVESTGGVGSDPPASVASPHRLTGVMVGTGVSKPRTMRHTRSAASNAAGSRSRIASAINDESAEYCQRYNPSAL